MPLERGRKFKNVINNIEELMTTKPSKTRSKAINTIAKRRGVSKEEAKKIQSSAIAYSYAGLRKKGKR